MKEGYRTTARRVISVFLHFLRPYRLRYGVIVFCVVVSEILSAVLIPQLLRLIVDGLATPFSGDPLEYTEVFHLFLFICIVYVPQWGLYRIAGFLHGYVLLTIGRNLDVSSLADTLRHSHRFFQDQFAGSLMRKIQRLSTSFENMLEWITWTVIPLIVSLIGITIILWRETWMLGLGVVIWFGIFVVSNYLVSMWKLKYDLVRSEKNTVHNGRMSDILSNATTVKAFRRESFERQTFFRVADDSRRARLASFYLSETNNAVQYFFILLLEVIIIYVAIRKWEAGTLTVGTFVMYQAYIRVLSNNVFGLGRLIRQFYEAFADAKEMIDIIDMPPEVKDLPRAKKLVVSSGRIIFQDVRFTYHEGRSVLKDFSLAIDAGEKVALVGTSGAGKSTITKLLFRFYDLDQGAILIDGQDISHVTQQSLRDAISLVPQEPLLFHRSLRENIAYGRLDATEKEIVSAAKKAHCHEFISSLQNGYDTLVGERGIKLSGGERQRVAIARAILKDAPILVLDEATSSLDSESEALIQDALKQLMKNKTVIVIAHRLSTIMQMDRIIVMEKGKVVDQGTHQELLKNVGIYQKLWNIQAGGFQTV